MDDQKLKDLLDQYLTGTITKEGKSQLAALLDEDGYRAKLEAYLEEAFRNDSFVIEEDEQLRTRIQAFLAERIHGGEQEKVPSLMPVTQHRFIRLWKYAAAVIIIFTVGAYFMRDHQHQHVQATSPALTVADEVAPGKHKATLTLADGQKILLDSVENRRFTLQGGAVVSVRNGELVYHQNGGATSEVVYNVLGTSKGETYVTSLSDGTKVWLNSGSSIRFPVFFTGKNRRVEVTGEAYFEVAKNREKPFIVQVGSSEVQVLGTHFNVMAYGDESMVKTTLLEGSIRFVNGRRSDILRPGQQLQLSNDGGIHVLDDVDLEKVIAWKEGMFLFKGEKLEDVMRVIARWYDIQVVYKKRLEDLFYLEMPRSSKLSDILKVLELTGNIRFEISGKTVTVKDK